VVIIPGLLAGLIAGLSLEPIYLPPVIDPFSQGAYYIPEIGGNDFAVATLSLNLPSAFVIGAFVPAAAAAVKQAITVRRQFTMIFPQGIECIL